MVDLYPALELRKQQLIKIWLDTLSSAKLLDVSIKDSVMASQQATITMGTILWPVIFPMLLKALTQIILQAAKVGK